MIYIRYKSLPPGKHAEAEPGARSTVIYLLPGLTAAQRQAALRRLRQEGSRGCGPALPARELLAALAADWMLTGLRRVAAAVRAHPGRTLLPAVLACLLLVLVATVSGSVDAGPRPLRVPPAQAPAGSAGSAGIGGAVSGSAYEAGLADSARPGGACYGGFTTSASRERGAHGRTACRRDGG